MRWVSSGMKRISNWAPCGDFSPKVYPIVAGPMSGFCPIIATAVWSCMQAMRLLVRCAWNEKNWKFGIELELKPHVAKQIAPSRN
jgi:hypothetical protein